LIRPARVKVVNMPDANIRMSASVRPWWHWLSLSVVVIALDQLTKAAIHARFEYGESFYVAPFFNLVLVYNKGAAFSFLADAGGWQRGFFIILTLVIASVLVWMMRASPANRLLCIALSLVLGGAFGNLYDRVALGHVVDFIQWHAAGYYWPAFNIADSAIFLGAVGLVIDGFRKHPDSGAAGERS
jgi:signal peptidase II